MSDSSYLSKRYYCNLWLYTPKLFSTDLYGGNHGSDKPISRMIEGKGNVVIDMKK
jgi:hypothetical protein